MKNQTKFFITGLIGGLICVAPGTSLLVIFTLTWGVGLAFFAAVVVGIITGARQHLQIGPLRYIAGLPICIITYMAALTILFGVGGHSSDWFGFKQSTDFEQFGLDIFIGLVAAAIFAASGIAFFGFVLTGRWSNLLLRRLLLAGIVTIVVTFIVNYPFRSFWSFYGVLVPLGSSLFCGSVGAHIQGATFRSSLPDAGGAGGLPELVIPNAAE
jgi:hypothetical protein